MFVLETRLFRPQAAITIAISRFAPEPPEQFANPRPRSPRSSRSSRDEKLIGAGVGTEDTFVV